MLAVLAFDTSTPAVTVALRDDSAVLAERTVVDARRHGELLAPGIAAVLSAAGRETSELTAIAVGVGPGPFTGLRVGLVTALALGDALRIRVYGVCSLDILAYASKLDGAYAVATDARRREVYWARYSGWPEPKAPMLTARARRRRRRSDCRSWELERCSIRTISQTPESPGSPWRRRWRTGWLSAVPRSHRSRFICAGRTRSYRLLASW